MYMKDSGIVRVQSEENNSPRNDGRMDVFTGTYGVISESGICRIYCTECIDVEKIYEADQYSNTNV